MLVNTHRFGFEFLRRWWWLDEADPEEPRKMRHSFSLYVRVGAYRGVEAFVCPGSGLSRCNTFDCAAANQEPC